MAERVKFASQMDATLLLEIKKYAKESDRTLSGVINEAVDQYLDRVRVRPVFRNATEEVLVEHADLLGRLAK
jgi:hypothetical protein